MKKLILILILSKYFSLKSITKCPEIPFKKDKCFDLDIIETENKFLNSKYQIQQYQKCEKGKICLIHSNKGSCIEKPKKNLNEECFSNSDCKSNICKSFKCTGKKLKKNCKSTNECSLNLFCYKNKCEKLNDLNEECDSNSFGNCKMGLVCHKKNYLDKNGICIKFSSLENGEETINPFACKSGYIGNKGICSNVYMKGIHKQFYWSFCEYEEDNGFEKKNYNMECQVSSKGDIRNPFDNYHQNWNEFKENYLKYVFIKEKDFSFDYSHNQLYLDEEFVKRAYVKFKYYNFISDADKCAYDYIFNFDDDRSAFE